MDREPKNIRLIELASRLACYHTVPVVLEPGDATRYDFTIARSAFEPGRLIVVRTRGKGGEMRAAAFVYLDATFHESREGIRTLSCDFTWCEELFAWWFAELWSAIGEAEGEPAVAAVLESRAALRSRP